MYLLLYYIILYYIYYTVLYHIISYYILYYILYYFLYYILYCIVSYHIISYRIVLYSIVLYRIVSYHLHIVVQYSFLNLIALAYPRNHIVLTSELCWKHWSIWTYLETKTYTERGGADLASERTNCQKMQQDHRHGAAMEPSRRRSLLIYTHIYYIYIYTYTYLHTTSYIYHTYTYISYILR